MALVRKMSMVSLERDAPHLEVDCTYSIISVAGSEKFLQIDTYGSRKRKMRGKKSQSIRFSTEALRKIREVIKNEFSD